MWRPRPLLCLSLFAAACSSPDGPPEAAFLAVTRDSTMLIESDGARIQVRRSELLLAEVDGRWYEFYVTDEDFSFYDALLVGQQVYRRDLVSGDSSMILSDSTVASFAGEYALAHSAERPLRPGEETAPEPRTQVTTDVHLVDAIGPYLNFEMHLDIDVVQERDEHRVDHGVVDVRSGRRVALADLVADSVATRIIAEGRRRLAMMVDSIMVATDERAELARGSVAGLVFDERAFHLEDRGGRANLAFVVPGVGESAGGYALRLEGIPLPNGTLPADALARAGRPGRRGQQVWWLPGYQVVSSPPTDDGFVTLSLRRRWRTWPAATIGQPVRRIQVLPKDIELRRAIAEPFDRVQGEAGELRIASERRHTERRRLPFRHVWNRELLANPRRSSPT